MLLDRGLGKAVELAKMEVTNVDGEKTEKQVLIINGQKVVF
jgi:hypothetical protein